MPIDVCRGRTEHDINLAFAQINLTPVYFHAKSESGVFGLCKGVFMADDERGRSRTYIRMDPEGIEELLVNADRLMERYHKVLEYDDCPDENLDLSGNRLIQYTPDPWEGRHTDLPEALSWENIKQYCQPNK